MRAAEVSVPGLARLQGGEIIERLALARVWLVDPVSGREGPAVLSVRAGTWDEVRWLDGVDRPALLLLPGLIELSAAVADEERAAAHGGFSRVLSAREQDASGIRFVHHPLAEGRAEASDGVPATILGLHGVPPTDEADAVEHALAELRQQAAETGPADAPPLHLAHLSTSSAVRLVASARASGLPVTCDVTVGHMCLHDGWVGGDRRFSWQAAAAPWTGEPAQAPPYHPATRVDPPLRSAGEALSLASALAGGDVQVLSSGHLPREPHEHDVPYGDAPPGMSTIETCLSLVLAADQASVLPLAAAVKALTAGPAEIAGLPVPRVVPGQPADFVLVDRGQQWHVDSGSLVSRGRNTPLIGRSLPGRVLLTVAGGRTMWVDESAAQRVREATSGRR